MKSLPLIVLCGYASLISANEPIIVNDLRPQISVTGSASIDVPPDHAKIKISVNTVERAYESAFKENTNKVNSILSVLQSHSIAQKDIATGYVSLSKKEAERESGAPEFIGYEAKNEITIILRDLSKYDVLMSAIIKSGVDEIESVSFGNDGEIAKRKEARLMAIKAAKEKADYFAGALNQTVCEPIKISETPTNSSSNYSNTFYYSAPEVVTSSLVPNNIRVSASVDVTFLLCK